MQSIVHAARRTLLAGTIQAGRGGWDAGKDKFSLPLPAPALEY